MAPAKRHSLDSDSEVTTKKPKLLQRKESSSDEDYSSDEEQGNTSQLSPQNYNLYLETINRKVLDFDYTKTCSVSLSSSSVYCCLVCNKYLRGRSSNTEAYKHSIDSNHHVFINFDNLKVFILPDGYELCSENAIDSFKDIQNLISPKYSKEKIRLLNQGKINGINLNENQYIPGFIGLNNMSSVNDYSNVVLLCLSHVYPVRDFFLINDTLKNDGLDLSDLFSLFLRKLWYDRLFKHHLSANELMKLVAVLSKGKFTLSEQRSPKEFLSWLLNSLNSELKVKIKTNNVISNTLQGKLKLKEGKETKFWFLTLKLPSLTLFKDSENAVVQQFKLEDLLEKLPYQISKLPKVLIISVDRTTTQQEIIGIHDLNSSLVLFDPDNLNYLGKTYKLTANVVFETNREMDSDGIEELKVHYKVQLFNKTDSKWYEIDDLNVQEIQKELLVYNMSSLQFWELQ